MINLEKIDPNIMRQIQERTLKEIVHSKREPSITRENDIPEKPPPIPIGSLKRRVKKYNKFFKKEDINIFLYIEEEEQDLYLSIFNRETGERIQIFQNNEVEEMMLKLESFMGLFIDNRI